MPLKANIKKIAEKLRVIHTPNFIYTKMKTNKINQKRNFLNYTRIQNLNQEIY